MFGDNVTVRNAGLDAITTAAGASALIKLCDGTRPATGGALTNVLASLTCSATFAPASAGGVLTANAITTSNALLSGTCTWGRLQTSGGTQVTDFSAGASVVTTITGTSGQDTVTVGSATGIVAGMYLTGTGIGTGAVVDFVTGTTVHLTVVNSGTPSGNGTFAFELTLTPAAITAGQPVQITSFVRTAGNA